MPESSADNAPQVKVPAEPDTSPKVPVKVVAKERAEKRAARAEADDLRAQLEELKGKDIDMDALVKGFSELVETTANAAVEQALKPARQEVERYKLALRLGLNEGQAEAIYGVMDQFPGMAEAEALALARTRKPELFQAQRKGYDPSVHGQVPASGDSPTRFTSDDDEYLTKMKEAQSPSERKFWAEKEFLRRINRAYKSSN